MPCPASNMLLTPRSLLILVASPPAAPPQVLAQKQNLLNILSRTTGHSPEKLDKVRMMLIPM